MERALMYTELSEEDMGDATAGLCFARWCQRVYETGRIMDERARLKAEEIREETGKQKKRGSSLLRRIFRRGN